MDIVINILVITFTIIFFLLAYYLSINKTSQKKNYRLPLNNLEKKTDLEVGKEIGADVKPMYDEVVEDKNEQLSGDTVQELAEKYPLKEKYNHQYVRLFSRDPEYLFCYWEIHDEEFYKHPPFLQLKNESTSDVLEIEINHYSWNWYLKSQPNNEYIIIIGYKKNGIFIPVISSNKVKTPMDRPSNIIDDHWMTIEELSRYHYRLETDSLTLLKSIEGRKKLQEIEADSFALVNREY